MTSEKDNLNNQASETRDARTDGHSVSAAQSASAPSKPVPQYLTTELVLPKGVREQFEAEQAAARAAAEAAAREEAARAAEESAARDADNLAESASAEGGVATEEAAAKPRRPKHAAPEKKPVFQGVPTVEQLYAGSASSAGKKSNSQKIPLMTDLIGAEGVRKRAEAAAQAAKAKASAADAAPSIAATSVDDAAPSSQVASSQDGAAEQVRDARVGSAAQRTNEPSGQEPELQQDAQNTQAFAEDGFADEALPDSSAEQGDEYADADADLEQGLGSDEAFESYDDEEYVGEYADAEDFQEGLDAEFADEEPVSRAPIPKAWRYVGIFLCVVFAICSLCLATYGFDRWLHGSDELNLEGTWQIEDSDATVSITDKQIVFADDAVYDYKVDTTTKSLSLTLAGLSGQAHYCFSFDKDTLVFVDGDPGTALTSAANDFPWWITQNASEILPIDPSKAVPEGGVVLHREK